MLKDTTTGKDDRDLIDSVRKKGAKAKRGEPAAIDPKHIERSVRKSYEFDKNLDENTRIINAIEHLTKRFPRHLVPINLIYWMVFGGPRLKPQANPEIVEFGKKVGRTKKKMKAVHKRSFIIKNGMVRGLVDAEEHADIEMPRAVSRLKSAYQNAQVVKSLVGDPEALDERKLERTSIEQVSKTARAIENMGNHIKALLPPPSKTP